MLPKAHLTSHSRTSGSRWVATLLWWSGLLRSFCTVLYIPATSSWSPLLLLGPYLFCPLLWPSLHEMFPGSSSFLEENSSLSHSIVFLEEKLRTAMFSSVQFSHSVMSDSLQPRESQHARPPCPSPTPGIHPNPCPSSQWCHPAISSSVIPFSSCPQSLSASGSFPMSHLFTWGNQSIGVSTSASVLPMNTQDWSPLGWTGWISLQSKGFSRVFSNTIVQSINFSVLSFLHSPTLTSIHDHWKNP